MKKHRFNAAAMGFIILIVIVVGLLMSRSLRRTSYVTLPDPIPQSSESVGSSQYGEDIVNKIEVTPATVQAVISTLARPESYSRILVVEWAWEDVSSISRMTVQVSGDLTKIDSQRSDGRIRHVVTDGVRTAIWYNDEKSYYVGSAGDVSADQEQSIPTYEDILRLDPEQIAMADYRIFSDENCIFVELKPDEFGVVQRYWVSVASGLLIGAERMDGNVPFYRVAAQQVTTENSVGEEAFRLPDGSTLADH